jgi:hypothetical protein
VPGQLQGSGVPSPAETPDRLDPEGLEPAFSPDGRSIAFVSDRPGSAEIWIADADGGERSLVVSGRLCRDWQETIAAEDGLHFVRRGRERSTLGFDGYAAARSDSMASLEWPAASLALSPDRSMLLYDCIGNIEDDLMFVEVRE